MKFRFLPAIFLGGLLFPSLSQGADKKSPEELKKASYQVDKFVAEIFKSKKLTVPDVVDDATFLRRSFLVANGRIPTLKEAQNFLEIEDPNKREMLTRYLLGTDGYRSHMQNYVMDLLRVTDSGGNRNNTLVPYVQYIHDSVAENKPWDQFTRELVSASGIAWEPGNGAVGYYVRDKGMPLDNMSITMQIFTGERLECAQCHDSPLNKWERMDFFQLAAFTSGQREMNPNIWRQTVNMVDDPDFRRSDLGKIMYWMEDNIHYLTLEDGGDGRIKLPRDYQYRDGDPGEMVGGKTHFGQRISSSARRETKGARQKFANWITTKNDNFDYVIVNRLWGRVMGSPLTLPVDEFVMEEKTLSPGLTRYLKRLMVDLDYDLKAFQQVLLGTRTFQFAANSKAFEVGVPQAFNGRQLQRMSSEQLWDSLVTLIADEPDKLAKRQFSDNIYYNGKPVLVGEKTMSQLAREVMAIKKPAEYRAYAENLMARFQDTSGSASSDMMMMARKERPGPAKGVARASELPAPAPPGHFLREFGQSDRTLVNAATNDANMAQVLQIMNGHVEKLVVNNKGAAVYNALEEGSTDADKVRYLYYAILSRPPSDAEMNMLMRDVIDGGRDSYQNLVSALLSTHEFMFVQ
ncbi:DUF1549 and DUF1553 domain-containing protein [bacterium]|nr:DUF1549 and DUF1553 domain-containing protein [bacterium]